MAARIGRRLFRIRSYSKSKHRFGRRTARRNLPQAVFQLAIAFPRLFQGRGPAQALLRGDVVHREKEPRSRAHIDNRASSRQRLHSRTTARHIRIQAETAIVLSPRELLRPIKGSRGVTPLSCCRTLGNDDNTANKPRLHFCPCLSGRRQSLRDGIITRPSRFSTLSNCISRPCPP